MSNFDMLKWILFILVIVGIVFLVLAITKNKSGKREIEIEIENIEDSNKVGADADTFIAIHNLEMGKIWKLGN
jgi:hypothetical protein